MSTTTPTTTQTISRFYLQWRLYGANVLTVISQAAAIMVAKTFNAAITQSITPDTACSESPQGTWTGFFGQLAFVAVTALVVLRVWYLHAAHANALGGQERKDDEERQHSLAVWRTGTWDLRKFAAGEVLGWATKELTAIAVALVAVGLGYERPPEEEEEGSDKDDPGRLLRDAMQGDSPLTGVTQNDWKQVAAYAIYACLLSVVAFFLFVPPGATHLQAAVHHNYNANHRLRRWLRDHHGSLLPQLELEKETINDLALELATESLKIPQAYTLHGTFSGMIAVAIFSTNNGDPVDQFTWGAFGILEVYAIVTLYLGGFIFSRRFSCANLKEFLEPLTDFYEDVWGCLAGLALGSIATSPGGILSGLDEHLDGTAADAVRAASVSGLALVFLFHGSHIRVYDSFFYCCTVSPKMAQKTAHFFVTASSLAFAWAWEDFSNDVVCEELPQFGIGETGAVWINFWVMAAIMIPISIFFSLQAQKAMKPVQRDLDALFGMDTTKAESEAPTSLETAPPPQASRGSGGPEEFVIEQLEEVVTQVEI